jgi:hypothetical protein
MVRTNPRKETGFLANKNRSRCRVFARNPVSDIGVIYSGFQVYEVHPPNPVTLAKPGFFVPKREESPCVHAGSISTNTLTQNLSSVRCKTKLVSAANQSEAISKPCYTVIMRKLSKLTLNPYQIKYFDVGVPVWQAKI